VSYGDSTWNYGKYKGTPIQEVPTDYLSWAAANMELRTAKTAAAKELTRRNQDVPEPKIKNEREKTADQVQYEIRKVHAVMGEITAGLNRLLIHAGLPPVSIDPKPGRISRPRPEANYEPAPGYIEGEEIGTEDTPF
jgi:uncharacterized protein (DUF3820 family)